MPLIEATVSCPIYESFRVNQVAGMFDVPLTERASETFRVEVPDIGEDWRIGAIVGPSGSGKTTVARQAFARSDARERPSLLLDGEWAKQAAIIDLFPEDRGIPHVIGALTSVGLSSPPTWLKPFRVLSTGEQFRCELAYALLTDCQLMVFDEFTSVVDRTVAKIGSLAVQRAVRTGKTRTQKFVAVTCHYDVLEWLEPDWVLDMATRQLARGSLWRRPPIELEVVRCRHDAWRLFGPHHYLSASLNKAARCYLATWQGQPVAFAALLAAFGKHNSGWRVHRIVVLPDYQGVGIGGRFLDCVAELECRVESTEPWTVTSETRYECVRIVTSHPAMIAHCERSPRWRCHAVRPLGQAARASDDRTNSVRSSRSFGRPTKSFTFLG